MSKVNPTADIIALDNAVTAASAYIARGLSPVPIPKGQKGPWIKGWEARRFREPDFEPNMNVGLHTGEPSGGLADVDLDCSESLTAAKRWLPPTEMRFGRERRPSSHYLFAIDSALRREVFKDPELNGKKATLLELRGDGHQSMAPPSIHPDGDRVRWELFGKPACIKLELLRTYARRIAAASLLSRYWRDGERHEGALALSGFLFRHGWDEEDTVDFLDGMAEVVGADRRKVTAAVSDTARRIRDGLPATGGPTLRSLFPGRVLASAFRWLGLSPTVGIAAAAVIGSPSADAVQQEGPLTDLFNARLFADQHAADVRFVHDANRWFVYDGCRWVADPDGAIERRAKHTVESLYRLADKEMSETRRTEIRRHALRSQDGRRIAALLKLARSEPSIAATRGLFDPNQMLLNCLNGTIELQSGVLRPHRREDFVTNVAPVDFDAGARAPLFEAFVNQIMGGSQELVDYLQRAIGYSATGDISEHRMFVAYGSGANGKSTLLRAIKRALGSYAISTPVDTFVTKKQNAGIPNDIARLAGSRFVCAVEAEEDQRLAEEKIKQLTGGDDVTARFLHQEYFEFRPTSKFWLATNHRPRVRGTDEAIWRRIDLVPFSVTIPEQERDRKLEEKFAAELPGILAWIVAGCLRWLAEGLRSPTEVRQATAMYRREEDVLGTFIEECCTLGPSGRTPSSELYEAYKSFCENTGEKYPLSQKRLAPKWRGRGLGETRDSKGRVLWTGIELRPGDAGSWA